MGEVAKETFKYILYGNKKRTAEEIVADVMTTAHSMDSALNLLKNQGIDIDEARAALDLLTEIIRKELIAPESREENSNGH